MTNIINYNLVKEGDIYNDTSVSTYNVTVSGINLLYSGKLDQTAFTVPVGSVASLIVEFGEYYKVGNFKLYSDPINVDDISATYGLQYVDESAVSVVSSGTYSFGDISDVLGFMCITISGSLDTDVYQLVVEGESNDSIGFGTTSTGTIDQVNLEGVPTGYYSPNPVSVSVYNEYPYTVDIKSSVAPTGSGVDNYIYLSTEVDGAYYGINDYGIKQPSFISISDVDESLDLSSESEILERWDFVLSSSSYIYADSGYLRIYSSNNYIPEHRKTAPYNGYTDAFLVSKNEFTANQSFTISLEVKIVDATLDNMEEAAASVTSNKFFLGFTDSYPIRDHYTNSTTKDRLGRSLAAVWVGAHEGLGEDTDLAVGSAANDFDFDRYTGTTDFHTARNNSNSHPIVSSILLEYLSEYVFNESNYLDGSTSAPWRTLKLSYDHRTRTAYYYFDSISIGQVQFSSSAFFENCRMFFGYSGVGQFAVDMRNFTVEKNAVHRVYSKQSTAAASSSKGSDHLPSKMIDGVYGSQYYTSSWISDNNPASGDYFYIEFSEQSNIDAVRVRQPSVSESISISGSVVEPARYSLDSTTLYFDTGDVRTIEFASTPPSGMDGWDVSYMTTTSGTIESVSGVTSVSGIILTLNDRGSSPTKTPVLAIDEIEFYTISGTTVPTDNTTVSGTFPWSKGYSENIKHFGSSASFELDSTSNYDVAGAVDCSKLVRYSDFDASSPVLDSVSWSDNDYLHHYFESAFMIYDRDNAYSEGNILNGSSGWFWRFFDYPVDVRGVYVYILSGSDSLSANIDTWKVQYLKEGGNPNLSSDWTDIPPISNTYHGSGDYSTYVDYLIANNDGEYYTDYINALDFMSGVNPVELPSDVLCQKNSYNKPGYIFKAANLSAAGLYIEFDQFYKTQGIKFVIGSGYEDKLKVTAASGYTISLFMCYGEKSTGYYLSPVFDTGTKQNTERIFVDVDEYSGNSYAFYRSSSTPPTYKHESEYERWESVCSPFGGMENIPDWTPFFNGADIAVVGDTAYFLGQNTTKTIKFNTKSGRWSWGASYPTETTGQDIKPDLLTTNNTVTIGGKLVCACTSDGGAGTRTSGLMQYNITANDYSYTGWELFPYQRQVEAVYASMVSDGSNRLFFFGRDGTVTLFYVSTGSLTTEDRQSMPLYGYSKREYFVPVYVNGKIYIFGGSVGVAGTGPGNILDIYDVNNDVWTTGTQAPYKVERASAIHYDGYIYILPVAQTYGAESAPFMKYSIEDDSWTVLPQLGYNYQSHYVDAGAGFTGNRPLLYRYFLSGDYIYGFNYINSQLDFRRFKVGKSSWESGDLPIADDTLWSNNGGASWTKITSVSGELMPQDKYIQYKVVLESTGSEATPIINGVTIVQPLSINNVESGGTGTFYVKSGVSVEDFYEAWYTGFTAPNDFDNYYSSVLYSRSSNGYEFNKSTSSLYDVTTSGGSGDTVMYYDSCVVKDSSGYEMWASHAKLTGSNSFDVTWGNIHKVTISGGYNTYSPQHSLARGTQGVYDVESIYSPSVIKSGGLYKMWYTGVDSSSVHRILYADSSNGLDWSNLVLVQDIGTTSLEPDADYAAAKKPSVVYSEGTYYMWYEGVDSVGESRIIHCQSLNGTDWSQHSIVMDKDNITSVEAIGCGAPSVVLDLDTYKMWFIVYGKYEDVVYYSESSGGTVWSGIKPALTRKHEGVYDFSRITSINVIVDRSLLDVPTIHNGQLKIYND